MATGTKRYHLITMVIFYCLCPLWGIMALSGCHQVSRNIPDSLKTGDVTLLWNDIPGAIAYNVYMSGTPGVTQTSGHIIPEVTNPVRVNQLEPGKTYYFVVTAVDASGESKASEERSYRAVADKIGLVYWKDAFEEPFGNLASSTPETIQNETLYGKAITEPEEVPLVNEFPKPRDHEEIPVEAEPDKTIMDPERSPLQREASKPGPAEARQAQAKAEKTLTDLEKAPAETIPIETEPDAALPKTDNVPAEKDAPKPYTAGAAGSEDASEKTLTKAEKNPLKNGDPDDRAPDDVHSTLSVKEDVETPVEDSFETAAIGKRPAADKPATIPTDEAPDPDLPELEEIRLKAARRLAESHFYIFFDQDSNDLSSEAIEKLNKVYTILANNTEARVKLNGYSDSSSDPSFNQMVSEVRAGSVMSYLAGRGIPSSRMAAFGHGDRKSLASNDSAEGRRLNRRVEIELIMPGTPDDP